MIINAILILYIKEISNISIVYRKVDCLHGYPLLSTLDLNWSKIKICKKANTIITTKKLKLITDIFIRQHKNLSVTSTTKY